MDEFTKQRINRSVDGVCSYRSRHEWISKARFVAFAIVPLVISAIAIFVMIFAIESKQEEQKTVNKPDTTVCKKYGGLYEGEKTIRFDFPGSTNVFEPVPLFWTDSE